MNIEPQEIINFIECQKKVFDDLLIERDRDDFYRGVIEGMNIVKHYINIYIDIQDKGIAEANHEIQSNIDPKDHK